MARSQRSSKLESRTARLSLPKGARVFLTLARNVALIYRRTENNYGTWQARVWDGKRFHYSPLGRADDYQDANDTDVLDYRQALERANDFYKEAMSGKVARRDTTVAQAATHYMDWFRSARKSVKETEHTVNAHILPAFGERRLYDLTANEIKAWVKKLATRPPMRRARLGGKRRYGEKPSTPEERRARQATANRILTVFKAILNKAFADELVKDDKAWRRVKPFDNTDEPIIRFLTADESTRLVNACRADLRSLVKAALFTGARYSEITGLRASDFNVETGQVYFRPAKSGRGRHVPLNAEGCDFFERAAAGKNARDSIFTRQDGKPWGKNHQVRLLADACQNARIEPAITFHDLRHTYASTLAQAGVDLLAISKLLGHADTRITSKHYAHLADKTLSDAVKKHLPGFGHRPDKKIVSMH